MLQCFRYFIAGVCLTAAASLVQAMDFKTSVISLKYRTPTELVPIIEPLLVKDGVITSSQNKLIIRSTPDNLAGIQKVLQEIDVAAKRLRITVTADAARVREEQQISGRLTLENGNASGEVTLYQTYPKYQGITTQAMQVTEGQWATLQTGQSIPIVDQQKNPDGSVTATTRYKDVTQGFDVLPRVNGDIVNLAIRPKQSRLSREGGGKIDVQQMETTLTGKLGEWLAIGGIVNEQQSFQSNHLSTQRQSAEKDELYVKVELLP